MKTVGYCALLYGSEYLGYAIRSMIDYVDEFWILYTDVGSHGSRTLQQCPDTRDELMEIAAREAGGKLGWVDGRWDYENQQREMIHKVAPDADIIIVCDYDEIYPVGLIPELIDQTKTWRRRNIRVPMVHFYRSFYRAILHDPASPVRVIYPHVKEGEEKVNSRPLLHFGYAIKPAMMRWKWQIHGHRNELRRDVDYFTDIYEANRQTDCHPVGSEHWNAEPVDPFALGLPDFMRQHPYANMEVIE